MLNGEVCPARHKLLGSAQWLLDTFCTCMCAHTCRSEQACHWLCVCVYSHCVCTYPFLYKPKHVMLPTASLYIFDRAIKVCRLHASALTPVRQCEASPGACILKFLPGTGIQLKKLWSSQFDVQMWYNSIFPHLPSTPNLGLCGEMLTSQALSVW